MSPETGSSGRLPDGGRPGLGAHHVRVLAIPTAFPEAFAHAAGERLEIAEADEVPMMLRSGLPIDRYLTSGEIAAHLALGDRAFERWFRLGWARAAGDEGA